MEEEAIRLSIYDADIPCHVHVTVYVYYAVKKCQGVKMYCLMKGAR